MTPANRTRTVPKSSTSRAAETNHAHCSAPRATPAGAGSTPPRRLRVVVCTSRTVCITHTSMQYRHRALISKVVCHHSHSTKTQPRVTPICSPHQYQAANRAPASTASATATTTA